MPDEEYENIWDRPNPEGWIMNQPDEELSTEESIELFVSIEGGSNEDIHFHNDIGTTDIDAPLPIELPPDINADWN
jgi:hypothetical protein